MNDLVTSKQTFTDQTNNNQPLRVHIFLEDVPMRRSILLLTLTTFCAALLLSSSGSAAGYWEKAKAKKQKAAAAATASGKKDTEKPFAEVIKGCDKIPGLFDFYVNKKDNQVYMAIKPGQLNKTYLCNLTLANADGNFYDAASMYGAFPFEIRQVGKRIQFIEINLRLRIDSTKALAKAVERSISDGIFSATTIASLPDTSGAFLIDPTSTFVTDASNVGYYVGSEGKTGYRFDRENSNFGTIKSFPLNTELDAVAHYRTDKPSGGTAVENPYSFLLTYHWSLSALPETGYRPRLSDDRVGYFTTIYQDYSNLDADQPYVRYINRWNLEKKDSTAAISEPKEPIVFWIENTTPLELRDAVRDGILFWNSAFEKAGFKNAVVAKQMPDTADWDPADVRYSTIRWFTTPGGSYAAGPSRANPFTGQIYDADIRVAADFMRHIFNYADNYIDPLSLGAKAKVNPFEFKPENILDKDKWQVEHRCDKMMGEMAVEGMAMISAFEPISSRPEVCQKYIKQYVTELIAHEVGHTLGLRHNFKASTVYTRAQQLDPVFTREHGTVGTVMEYAPPNYELKNLGAADFYTTVPGPYDNWAIEYGYKPIDAPSTEAEKVELDKIASRSGEPELIYATDEDCFGNSTRAVDPYVTQFDMGKDPVEYWKGSIEISKEYWSRFAREFEKPGERYAKLRSLFGFAWGSFSNGSSNLARFIGGLSVNRSHVGDPGAKPPFVPVPAAKQREVMKFISDNVWSGTAFQFPPELFNKLMPTRLEDFDGTMYQMQRLDYPYHSQVLRVQTMPLATIFSPATLFRLSDTEIHYAKGEDVYTMVETFQDVRRAIWSEVAAGKNISGIRRNLQRAHLGILVDLVTNTTLPVPEDAVTLARVDLRTLKGAIGNALSTGGLDTITKGHLDDSLAMINAALDARINLKM
jgi:hypothetical protein